MKLFASAATLAVPILIGAQQQTSNSRGGWPCNTQLDPSYFQVAEGTGGHLLLLAPDEIGESAPLLTAFGAHRQTIFRLAGSLKPGTHELQVPIDPSVESAVFSISVQCLQVAQVVPRQNWIGKESQRPCAETAPTERCLLSPAPAASVDT